MKRVIFILCLLFCVSVCLTAQNKYNEAWEALNKNDRSNAARLIAGGISDPEYGADNYITHLYLQSYNGGEKNVTDFESSFYNKVKNPYPYVYALWFNSAILGGYGKKSAPHQIKLIERLIADPQAPGTLVASAHYQKGIHLLFSNKPEDASKEYAYISNIANWQYTGPFENLSESGLYKDHGPLAHPESEAVFTSSTNAPVRWFAPSLENKDGWTPVRFNIQRRTAVVYAQTFVNAPEDQEVYCNAGFTGAIKVWINDKPVLTEYKERATELDAYTVKCSLKKGTNRILVALGYTNDNYPNFSIRLTDSRYKAIPGLTGSNQYTPYPKDVNTAAETIPHPAELFFKEKVALEPGNLLNYLLLADVYMRNKKTLEARNIIESAIKQAPGNYLLRFKLIEILIKENNRTQLVEEMEVIKANDPQSLFAIELKIKDDFKNEKYEDAAKAVDAREKLFGEDETTLSYRLNLLAQEKKYDDMVKVGEMAFKKYPDNDGFLPLMYSIRKEVYKDNKGALKVYENFLKNNFNYQVATKFSDLLNEQGQIEKSIQIKSQLLNQFRYDPSGYHNMSGHYYGTKEYDKATELIEKALALSPYNESYWEQMGDIKSETRQTADAISAYEKSLLYDPNQYNVINKIRKLRGKQESYRLVTGEDIDALIRKDRPEDAKNTDYGFYIIHDEKSVIMHPGGATEEYDLLIVKITNEKGIDKYKESTIGYGSSQTLLIEKSEVIKKSGAKAQGERNDNEIVFTNLEVGDIIVFKYRIQNYVYGRFAKEYWDKSYFTGQVYTNTTRYSLLLPKGQPVKYQFLNSDIKPVITEVEDFTRYTWEMVKSEPLEDEPLMPENGDVAAVLHISTIPSWQDIASWYSDIVNNRSEEDYEITTLFNKLFPEGPAKIKSQFGKAKIIYDYIEKNIRYSSVSFRQGAFVPQRASATLNTRLGDCKDLSNLFVTLCRMADIECYMVLTDTRDNGAKDLVLPSTDFNHCIARAILDGKDYFIELTDNNLPFTGLPNNLIGALILEIPGKKNAGKADLTALHSDRRIKDIIRRVITIKPVDSDLLMDMSCIKYGSFSSGVRATYNNLDYEKQLKEMEKTIASSYKNNIKLEKLHFSDLKDLSDSVTYTYSFKAKNEISEIGSLQTFRITYPDIIATLDNFSADTRVYPIEYNDYETADLYETIVTVNAPAGKKFVELPANETLLFSNMKFSIAYKQLLPGTLVVTRKFVSDRKDIPASKYVEFKAFFEKIIKAEQKVIAFK